MEPDNPASVEAALSALEKAISLSPTLYKSYLFSGYIHQATGKLDQAEVSFEKAIQCNPDCTEALEQLKALGQSRG
jgi:Tfp pilus assembly protein PilF